MQIISQCTQVPLHLRILLESICVCLTEPTKYQISTNWVLTWVQVNVMKQLIYFEPLQLKINNNCVFGIISSVACHWPLALINTSKDFIFVIHKFVMKYSFIRSLAEFLLSTWVWFMLCSKYCSLGLRTRPRTIPYFILCEIWNSRMWSERCAMIQVS